MTNQTENARKTNQTRKIMRTSVEFLEDYFNKRFPGTRPVIGMSGGKDSYVAAALCKIACPKEGRVIGVRLPMSRQKEDYHIAREQAKELGITLHTIDICEAVTSIVQSFEYIVPTSGATQETLTNLPPRIRMAALMAVAQSCNGRVVNTSNRSEAYIGWCTLFGDQLGHVAPLSTLRCTDVINVGKLLGLRDEWLDLPPADGLDVNNKTDEDKLGFTYETLDRFILNPEDCNDIPEEIREKIRKMHNNSAFKRDMVNIPRPEPT